MAHGISLPLTRNDDRGGCSAREKGKYPGHHSLAEAHSGCCTMISGLVATVKLHRQLHEQLCTRAQTQLTQCACRPCLCVHTVGKRGYELEACCNATTLRKRGRLAQRHVWHCACSNNNTGQDESAIRDTGTRESPKATRAGVVGRQIMRRGAYRLHHCKRVRQKSPTREWRRFENAAVREAKRKPA